jgi:hypothetical protein
LHATYELYVYNDNYFFKGPNKEWASTSSQYRKNDGGRVTLCAVRNHEKIPIYSGKFYPKIEEKKKKGFFETQFGETTFSTVHLGDGLLLRVDDANDLASEVKAFVWAQYNHDKLFTGIYSKMCKF